jgi:hypothetical protein
MGIKKPRFRGMRRTHWLKVEPRKDVFISFSRQPALLQLTRVMRFVRLMPECSQNGHQKNTESY